MKQILGLWVADERGLDNDTFEKSLAAIGYEVFIIDTSWTKAEIRAEALLMNRKFDYILHMPYGNLFNPKYIPYFSIKYKTPTILWGIDDDWFFDADVPYSTRILGPFHDWVVTSDEECIEKYKKVGCKNVIYEKISFSRSVWSREPRKDRYIDVYFCGRYNESRDKLVKSIDADGSSVKIDMSNGFPISMNEMVENYQNSKIALNFSVAVRDGKINNQIKGRVLEGMAAGCLVLSEYCPTIEKYFEVGKHLDVFTDEKSMNEKIKFYLKNKEAREEIASAGYEEVKKYTEEDKFQRIFREIENSRALGR